MAQVIHQILAGIAALEAQRADLGDAVVDLALAPLRDKLAALQAQERTAAPAQAEGAAGVASEGPAAAHRRVGSAAGAAQTLKQVSILFLDVVGSTSLSAELDPEDVHAVMNGALARGTEIVATHGGRVLQYAGDNLLAVWGAEEAHEDDPERAVRCGLALVAEARQWSKDVFARHGWSGFDVRVGVHTGNTLLGGGVEADGTIRGQAVNIAARMEQTAPRGAVRISQDTYRHVRGVFDLEPQAPIEVKGLDRPLLTYLVVAAKPRAFRIAARGVEGVETPLIGREADFGRLVAEFHETARDRTLRATTILAQAGLGKSRLMHDLQHWFDTQPHNSWLLLGRSQPGSTLQPYGLMRDALAWRLQISDSASAEEARRHLVEGLAPFFDEDAIEIRILGQLIGMDFSGDPHMVDYLRDPRLLRSRGFSAFSEFLRRLASAQGSLAVMLLDDLHWSDDASLEWLQYLMKEEDLPLFLVMGARPELLERFPQWCSNSPRHRELSLKALDAAQRRLLVQSLLSRIEELPAALSELIETQAEGNPFYAEELVKMLIDDGVIVVEGPVWRVQADQWRLARIPGTLTGVLQARLDRLASAEKRALQNASVIGPIFWDEALAAIDSESVAPLSDLRRRNFIYMRPESAFEDTREESFQHHLLHQVTYNTVLKAERRLAHSRAAAWLAEHVGSREAEYLSVTAEHYERSGETVQAVQWYRRAVDEAIARHANAAAFSYIQRLLALPGFDDANARFEILGKQQIVADLVGDRTLQAQSIDAAERLIDQCDDPIRKRIRVLVTRALLKDRIGRPAEAEQLAQEGAILCDEVGEAPNGALAYGELAWLAIGRAELPQAKVYLDRALHWAKQAARELKSPDDDLYEIQLLLVAADLHRAERDYELALRTMTEALALSQQRHYRRTEALCYDSMSNVFRELGDLHAAEEMALSGGRVARDAGFATIIASESLQLGRVAFERCDYAQTRRLAKRAAMDYRGIGDVERAANSEALEACALLEEKAWSEGLGLLERLQPVFLAQGMSEDVHACRILEAQCRLHLGHPTEALAILEAEPGALHAPEALRATFLEMYARLTVWRILTTLRDERARSALQDAMASLEGRLKKISDPEVRSRILSCRWTMREIVSAWQAAGGAGMLDGAAANVSGDAAAP